MDDPLVQQLTALLRRQHGAVTRAQMSELGLTHNDVRRAITHGIVERAAAGVYLSPGAPVTLDQRRTVALLAGGPAALLSHRAAACLLGFDRFLTEIVEISLPREARGRRLPITVHTTDHLTRLDAITFGGFRCTSGTRTVIDLARLRVARIQLEAAIDSAVRLGLSAPPVIVERLAELRGPGRWGARLLDRLLLDSGGHTLLERRFLGLVRRGGLPRPRPQVVKRRGSQHVARVDFNWDDQRIVVEVSGSRGHSSPADRARDAHRRNELQDLGWRVYEFTWEQVTGSGDWVIDTLRGYFGVS